MSFYLNKLKHYIMIFLLLYLIVATVYECVIISELYDCKDRKLRQLRVSSFSLFFNLILLVPLLNVFLFIVLNLVRGLVYLTIFPVYKIIKGDEFKFLMYPFYYLSTFTIFYGVPDLDNGFEYYCRINE